MLMQDFLAVILAFGSSVIMWFLYEDHTDTLEINDE